MATYWPARKGIDGEGDRQYIAPEVLDGQFDKPADMFALGLIAFETACNIFLPDHGEAWQALRDDDLSKLAVTLTSGEKSSVIRDANGIPIEHESGISPLNEETMGVGDNEKRRGFPFTAMTHDPSNLFGAQKRRENMNPPAFMTDPDDPNSLEMLVRWMLTPNPAGRPTAKQLLLTDALLWVQSVRTAGATVYEGNWGPQPESCPPDLVDTEMTGV